MLRSNQTIMKPGKQSKSRKVKYWQLIGIHRPISSYCLYKDICIPPYPNLLRAVFAPIWMHNCDTMQENRKFMFIALLFILAVYTGYVYLLKNAWAKFKLSCDDLDLSSHTQAITHYDPIDLTLIKSYIVAN